MLSHCCIIFDIMIFRARVPPESPSNKSNRRRRGLDARRQLKICHNHLSRLNLGSQGSRPNREHARLITLTVLAAVVDGRSWTRSPSWSCLLTVVIRFVYVCTVCVG